MKKLLILGSTGMLGNAVTKHFVSTGTYDIVTTYRDKGVAPEQKSVFFDVLKDDLSALPDDVDYIINCIGVIKPFMAQDPAAAIRINSLFPWQLARWCKERQVGLFHITTDCVFSGKKGKYVETDTHDALDDYGKSKSLGECQGAMVIRTSIIGEEIHKFASLISWAKSQKGKTVKGFSTHFWNGITTNWYGKICDKIIQEGLYEEGLFHVFAKDDVSKFQMMQFFNEKYSLQLTIENAAPEPCDRTLRTVKPLCEKLNVPCVKDMIGEL